MYLRSIRLENIRGFKELELDFTRPDGSFAGWTVIAGRNGAGKTSILRALALGSLAEEAPVASWLGRSSWVRKSSDSGKIRLVDSNGRQYSTEWSSADRLTFHGTPGLVGEAPFELACLTAYGAQRRLNGRGGTLEELAPRLSRVRSLFEDDVSLRDAIDWLRNDVYLLRLEGSESAMELEKNFLKLLNSGLLPDHAEVSRIDSDGLWLEQAGVSLALRQMADGYRVVTSLVAEILRRLYEGSETLQVSCDEPIRVLNPGVVLIDELEQHLHVTWQRRIGFWLKAHFPNVQFIVTTHSPFVCQAADPRGLIRLSGPGDTKPAEHVPEDVYYTVVNGSLDDAVLTELFGLESAFTEQAEAMRDRLAELEAAVQDRDLADREVEELQALRSKMPRSMSSDVENVIRRLAKSA